MNPGDRIDSGDARLDAIEAELAEQAPLTLLKALPHKYGPGKIHLLENGKTRCGKTQDTCPGKLERGDRDGITCVGCLNSLDADRRREEQRAKWERQAALRQARRDEEEARWWRRYNAYLETPEWRHRRALVLRRAGGICEGCLERRATQVHHTTYEHTRNELLWELRAVCDVCHDRCHPDKAA